MRREFVLLLGIFLGFDATFLYYKYFMPHEVSNSGQNASIGGPEKGPQTTSKPTVPIANIGGSICPPPPVCVNHPDRLPGSELPKTVEKECPEPPKIVINDLTLPPPKFFNKMPQSFQSTVDSAAFLKWYPVDWAREYGIHIVDKQGKTVKLITTAKTQFSLGEIPKTSNVAVAEYSLSLSSINLSGKPGPSGEKRTLFVRGLSSIIAPEIKSLKVEKFE